MLQVVTTPDGGRVRVEEVPPPGPRPGGAVVRTWYSLLVPAGWPGQVALCGQVIAAGPESPVRPGELAACGGPGFHAEQVWVPDEACAAVPDGVHPLDAVFAPLGGVALTAVQRAAPALGETVVVWGLGLMGLLAVQLLQAAGCRVLVVDPDPEWGAQAVRCGAELALQFGRDDVGGAVAARTGGTGADAVIHLGPGDPPTAGRAVCRPGGRVVGGGDWPVGRASGSLTVQPSGPVPPDLDLRLCALPMDGDATRRYLALLARRQVDPGAISTRRFPVTDAAGAFGQAAQQVAASRSRTRAVPPAAMTPAIMLEFPQATPLIPAVIIPAHIRGLRAGQVGLAVVAPDGEAQQALLPALARLDGARLCAVCSPNGLTARQLAERYGAAYCTAELEPILADRQVDAVLLLSRQVGHGPLMEQILAANKHVYTVQPLATSRAGLRALAEARAMSGRLLWAGFHRRYAPLVRRLAERLGQRAGAVMLQYRVLLAAPARPEAAPDRPPAAGPVEREGLLGRLCHHLDLALILVGARRVMVQALGTESVSGQGGANLMVSLRAPDGSLAGIACSALGPAGQAGIPGLGRARRGQHHPPGERLEVWRGGAVGVLEDCSRLVWADPSGQRDWRQGGADWGHLAELRQFIRAIREGGDDGFPAAAFATAAALTALESLPAGGEGEVWLGQI